MPKMNVAFSLDAEQLARFDHWRGPLSRGAALVKLLDSELRPVTVASLPRAHQPVPTVKWSLEEPEVDQAGAERRHYLSDLDEMLDEGGSKVTQAQLRSPESRELALKVAAKVLEVTEKRVGVVPALGLIDDGDPADD